MNDHSPGILRFLIELRKRLLHCLLAFTVIFCILFCFSNQLYTWLAYPLLKYLPKDHGLIATNIVAPFFVPFELTSVVALFLAIPFFLFHVWAFVAPALYQHERRLVWPLLLVSTVLFYLGIAFAYFIIFPIIFKFLIQTAPMGVQVSPDISQYLEFTLKLFFIFGLIFEVPIATILVVWAGLVTRARLIALRPYAIVSAFVIGMLVAPPDVLSQTLFAVPLWLLFELGIYFSRFFEKRHGYAHDNTR